MITFEVTYTTDDFQEAFRDTRKRRMGKSLVQRVVIFALLVICVAILFWIDRDDSVAWALVGAVFVLILSYVSAWRIYSKAAKQTWSTTAIFRYPLKFQIDDVAIRSDCEIASSRRKWECATAFRETPQLFFIFYGESQSHWFPKRVLTPLQIEELRALLPVKLPGKAL